LEASSREQVTVQDQELVRLRVAVREHGRALKEMGEDLAAKDKAIEHARSVQAVGEEAQATLVERLRLAEEQNRALLAVGEETERAVRTERADTDQVLAAKDEQIERYRLGDKEQRGVLREREEELAAKDEELERAAKKQRKTADNATHSYSQLGGQYNSRLVQVKQVHARGPWGLIATDRTPSLLK